MGGLTKGLIDALYDVVPAVKPQSAFYEMYRSVRSVCKKVCI